MIKSWKIQYLIQMSQKYNRYIDYLRLNISMSQTDNPLIPYFLSIKSKLDFNNSNVYIDNNAQLDTPITWQKVGLMHWIGIIWSIAYNGKSIPIMIIQEYYDANKKLLKSWWKIDYYGQFWRLTELWLINTMFFDENIKDLEVSRIDYKFDFMNYKPNRQANGYIQYDYFLTRSNQLTRKHWTISENWKNKLIHSWSLWDKENKTCVIRGYDKLKDSEAKGKTFLYLDYFDFKTVFRVEFEYWVKFCKGFTFSDLALLIQKIENNTWFKEYKTIGKEYYTYEKIDFNDSLERVRFIKYFQWYAKTLIRNWINPYLYIDNQMTKNGFEPYEINHYKNNTGVYITDNTWNVNYN